MQRDLLRLHGDTLSAMLERKRVVDSAWIVCWVSLLGIVAVPWFLSVLPIDLSRASWLVFGAALVYLVTSQLTDRLTSQRAIAIAMQSMPLVSIVLMGPLWHLVGGLANPIFLIAFVLPVIVSTSTAIGRHGPLSALLSIAVVSVIALAESADLRWYAAGGTKWVETTLNVLLDILPPRADIFAEVRTTPAYQFTILTTFAITQCLVAFLASPLATLVRRLDNRIHVSHQMLSEVQGLFHAVLSAEPDPSVIVYADSLQVVQASDSFFLRMALRPSQMSGKSFFDIVPFEQPSRVRLALSEASGQVLFAVQRVHDEIRIVNVHFHRTVHESVAYIYIGWHEVTALSYLETAFDAVDDPLLVIDDDSRLQYINRTAHHLFGELSDGMRLQEAPTLEAVLQQASADDEEEDAGRRTLDGRPYDVHQLSARMPGGAGGCTIVWLHCVAKEEALFEQAVRDPLTGIYNRRYFFDALGRHVAKSKAGRSLACAYFDLDYFKTINDTLGHAAGDAALLAFVKTVKNELRAVDVFARLGGDEFAALFVNCDLAVAVAALERIRNILNTDGWKYDSQTRHLSFSAGIAACRPDDDVTTLLERTDKAVYAAKAAGKGRTATEV